MASASGICDLEHNRWATPLPRKPFPARDGSWTTTTGEENLAPERRVVYRVNSIPGRHSQITVKRLTFPKNIEFDQFAARKVTAFDDE